MTHIFWQRKETFPPVTMNCKAAIITAVRIETDSVMCLYDNWEKVTFCGDAQEYYQASFSRNGKEYSLVTAQQNAMGMTAAASLSAKIMSRFPLNTSLCAELLPA